MKYCAIYGKLFLCLAYIHQTYPHFNIKNGKIWIQENRTEREADDELLALGVPKSDIVIGLQPSALRLLTGYAMA